MMSGRQRTTAMALVAILVISMAAGAEAAPRRTLQIEGSTTVGPIADAFAEAFMNSNKDVSITVKKTGSGDGAAALIDGRCDIASMSRFMKDKEFSQAVSNGVAPVAQSLVQLGKAQGIVLGIFSEVHSDVLFRSISRSVRRRRSARCGWPGRRG